MPSTPPPKHRPISPCCTPPQAALPESPRWLLLSGASRDEAGRALQRAEGRRASDPRVVAAELDGIAAANASSSGGGAAIGKEGVSALGLIANERFRRPLLIGSSLMLFQQITGQPSVLYYANSIFEKAGFAAGQVRGCCSGRRRGGTSPAHARLSFLMPGRRFAVSAPSAPSETLAAATPTLATRPHCRRRPRSAWCWAPSSC